MFGIFVAIVAAAIIFGGGKGTGAKKVSNNGSNNPGGWDRDRDNLIPLPLLSYII